MTMGTKVDDLATRRHALRVRIHNDERKLAIAYPQDAEKLRDDLERERAMLAELDEQLEDAKEQVREQMRAAVDAFFGARDSLLKLNGYFNDPGFTDTIFVRPYLSRGTATMGIAGLNSALLEPQDTYQVRQALLRVTEMEPVPDPVVSESQQVHEERVRNDRAGLGFFTDDELQRKAEDPIAFAHGRGAKVG
jgi:hypothetical protein